LSFVNKFAWSGAAVVLALVLALGLMGQSASAAVTIQVGTASVNLSTNAATGTGAYTALTTPPKYTEGLAADTAVGVNTATLTAPAGWSYNIAALTTTNVGADITSSTAVVTNATTITLTVTAGGVASVDSVQINGIQIRPNTASSVTGNGAWAVTAGTITGLAGTGITATATATTGCTAGALCVDALVLVPAGTTCTQAAIQAGSRPGTAVADGSNRSRFVCTSASRRPTTSTRPALSSTRTTRRSTVLL